MTTSIQAKNREYPLLSEIRQAWQSTKERVVTYIMDFSLKDVSYVVGIVLSGLCVIYARKGKTITAVCLAGLAEFTMYKGTVNKVAQIASDFGFQETFSDLDVSQSKETEPANMHQAAQAVSHLGVQTISSNSCETPLDSSRQLDVTPEEAVPFAGEVLPKANAESVAGALQRIDSSLLALQSLSSQEETGNKWRAWIGFITTTALLVLVGKK